MNVLDLFSGIGGFSLGLERAGMRTVAFCEIDPYCQAVLRKHWPTVPVFGDVRELTAEVLGIAQGNGWGAGWARRPDPTGEGQQQSKRSLSADVADTNGAKRETCDSIPSGNGESVTRDCRSAYGGIDLICGGFPCQDISVAGKGAGIAGERSGLWSEYARIIGEVRPRYVIIENVANLLSGRSADEQPIDRCLCGWPCRWRRVPVGSEQEGSMVHAALRYRHDGEGPSDIGETAQAIRRQSGQSPQGNGQMGSGAALGDRWESLPSDAQDDIAVSHTEEGTSATSDFSGQRARADDQAIGFRLEPEGAECSGEHWLCPSCGRALAHEPTRSVVTSWMGRVLGDLAALGFDAEWHCIPASAVGAPHRRDRVWIVADASGTRLLEIARNVDSASPQEARQPFYGSSISYAANDAQNCNGIGWCDTARQWRAEPDVGRVAHGVPARVDRLRALGNAVVPQIPEIIGRAIMSLEGEKS